MANQHVSDEEQQQNTRGVTAKLLGITSALETITKYS